MKVIDKKEKLPVIGFGSETAAKVFVEVLINPVITIFATACVIPVKFFGEEDID